MRYLALLYQKISITTLFLLLLNIGISAQGAVQDSTSTIPATEDKKSSFTTIFYGQPGKAALYSLIIPAGGQVYNKRIWKVPIVYAGEGIAAYNLIQSLRSFRSIDRCRRSLIETPSEVHPDCGQISTTSEAFTAWQSARSTKETAWIIMSAVHLLSVVEAFVDRHLINFDTSEDLSLHNMPAMDIIDHQFAPQPLNFVTFRISLN